MLNNLRSSYFLTNLNIALNKNRILVKLSYMRSILATRIWEALLSRFLFKQNI